MNIYQYDFLNVEIKKVEGLDLLLFFVEVNLFHKNFYEKTKAKFIF